MQQRGERLDGIHEHAGDQRGLCRINRRYGQLMALERQSLGDFSAAQRAELLDKLAHIEKSVIALKMPGSHATQLYALRQHMQFVRDNLAPSAKDP